MIYKHLLSELTKLQANAYDKTNVTHISYSKGIVIFNLDRKEIIEAQEALADTEMTISNLEKDLLTRDAYIKTLEGLNFKMKSEINSLNKK